MPQSLRTQMLKNAKRRSKYKAKKKVKRPNKGQEKRCVDNFRDLGKSEVETPLGYIDLLTDQCVLEFKIYTRAKDALGQILCYDHFVRKKHRIIVLFGKGITGWKGFKAFERVCALHDVEVFALTHSSVYAKLRKKLEDYG